MSCPGVGSQSDRTLGPGVNVQDNRAAGVIVPIKTCAVGGSACNALLGDTSEKEVCSMEDLYVWAQPGQRPNASVGYCCVPYI